MIFGALLLMIAVSSCREDSDKLMTYDHLDTTSFNKANESFAEKFKVAWNGLNQNYALWDYEAEFGLDWDAVYDEYLPQFEALDKKETVTDDEVLALMTKAFSPLHDGHMAVIFNNHKTGTKEIMFNPNGERVKTRDDYHIATTYTPSLKYYSQVANGEVETDSEGTPRVKEYSTLVGDLMKAVTEGQGTGLDWVNTKIAELSALSAPTAAQTARLDSLQSLKTALEAIDLKQLNAATAPTMINQFNALAKQYASLQVPALNYIDPNFTEFGMRVKFALLKGNIAYFHYSKHRLTPYIADAVAAQCFNMNEPMMKKHVQGIKDVWAEWFSTVQQLHKDGKLGGVILDVRGNGGGMKSDAGFIIGSLLPEGGAPFGYSRVKRGTGRFDYSTLSLNSVATMPDDEHEAITEPVVVMTNCMSLSMSEITTSIVRNMENGTHIGKRSMGGICELSSTNDTFSEDYMGHIGERYKTPVYIYLPRVATFTLKEKKIVEGIGIQPDIEVNLDEAKFKATGQDTQLDRALQFLRTGN